MNTYSTHFYNGDEITDYEACMVVEGFDMRNDAHPLDELYAWSYLIGTKLVYKLQGSYGRAATQMIDSGCISADGKILLSEDDLDKIK